MTNINHCLVNFYWTQSQKVLVDVLKIGVLCSFINPPGLYYVMNILDTNSDFPKYVSCFLQNSAFSLHHDAEYHVWQKMLSTSLLRMHCQKNIIVFMGKLLSYEVLVQDTRERKNNMYHLDKVHAKWKCVPFVLFVKRKHVIGISFVVYNGVQYSKIHMCISWRVIIYWH